MELLDGPLRSRKAGYIEVEDPATVRSVGEEAAGQSECHSRHRE